MFRLCRRGQFLSSDRDSVPQPYLGATLVLRGFVRPVDLQKGLSYRPREGITEEMKNERIRMRRVPCSPVGCSRDRS